MECCLCLLALTLFLSLPAANCQLAPEPQPFSTPGTCQEGGQVFRTGDLTCISCAATAGVSQDGLSCECAPGYYRQAASSDDSFTCIPCSQNVTTTTAYDGLICLLCGTGTSFNPRTGQCDRCSSQTEIFIDSLPTAQSALGNRSCEPCPVGTWADETGFTCVECGIPDCTQCDMPSGGICLSSSNTPISFPPTIYQFYSQNIRAAVDQCRAAANASACQLVANLCVLQTYLISDPACAQSLLLIGQHLPPLYYSQHRVLAINTQLRTRGSTSNLPLVLVAFSLNGTFLGLAEELTEQLFLCMGISSRSQSAWRVGLEYNHECYLTVSELIAHAEYPVFYDLFFRDVDPVTDSPQLVSVPVLVTNYLTTAQEPVNQGDTNRWQLVRRFFLVQAVTDDPLYARRMELVVSVTSSGIKLPYLRVTYSPWTPEDTRTFPCTFNTHYAQDGHPAIIGLSVTVAILTLGVMVYAGIKTNGFLRRTGGLCCEPHTLLYVCVELCAGISTAIFILLTVASTFYLGFFKGQAIYVFTLPIGDQELVFKILLGLALFFKIMHITYLVWHQSTVDIFFMDWERPKGLLLSSTQSTNVTPTSVQGPVSIWRTYFVANEWNEIQSLRKINHSLLLVLVLLFIHVVGLGNLAERDPVAQVRPSEDRYSAPPSDILRFSVTSLHFLIIAGILRLYAYLIHERYVEHKLHQFVDLCSVSNVSVFLTPNKLFGHYIHGRSVHGHADTNMREMNRNLNKEQSSMCGQRGLEVDSDLQIYEIALTPQFRDQFDRVLGPLRAERADGVLPPSATQQRTDGQSLSETVIKAYEALNHLLTSFCERSINGLDYSIKNKLLPEKIMGIEFHNAENSTVFYRDPGYSFDRVLFYGHFWNLFLLDLLIFAVLDLVSRDYVIATILTCIVSWVVDLIRDALGRRNLAKKTLVDSRFLI